MHIINCQINHLSNPLGYHLDTLTFSYQFDQQVTGKVQTSARIIIAKDKTLSHQVFDSHWRQDISPLGFSIPLKLSIRTRYYWQVFAKTDSKSVLESDVNWFETAKENEMWSGKWLTCDAQDTRHPMFEKKFNITKPVQKARLYICGLGLYVAQLNSKKVGNEYLTPGCNSYENWLQYQTYDVTNSIQKENKLEITLGNGWYKGRYGLNKPVHDHPWDLIAELHLEFTDGSQCVINSDTSWTAKQSTITSSGIYDGEKRDDTLNQDTLEVKLSTHPHASLHARQSIPLTIHEEVPVKSILSTPKGELVLDMGQNFAGIFRLNIHIPRGTHIQLQFGETLQKGNFYRENLRTAKQEYAYTSDGRNHVIIPHFTYYGYRFVKVTGITNISKSDFVGLAMYSDMAISGE